MERAESLRFETDRFQGVLSPEAMADVLRSEGIEIVGPTAAGDLRGAVAFRVGHSRRPVPFHDLNRHGSVHSFR